MKNFFIRKNYEYFQKKVPEVHYTDFQRVKYKKVRELRELLLFLEEL